MSEPGGRANLGPGEPGGRANVRAGEPGGRANLGPGEPGGRANLGPGEPGGRANVPADEPGISSGGFPAPADVIAHRPPFLFVDQVTALTPGQSARGVWRLTGEEWFFAGHFPGRPTLPGVLMCEAIAQVGAIAVLTDDRFAGKLPLFGGLDRARFRRQVVPGDELALEVELGRMSARAGKGSGRATVGGELACSCELLFVVVDAA